MLISRRHLARILPFLTVLPLGAKVTGPKAADTPKLPVSGIEIARRSKLPQSFNAMDWAEEFVAHVKDNPAIATDENTMVSWFANAIMAGYDQRERHIESEIAGCGMDRAQYFERKAIAGAVARGWCADANQHKAFDGELAIAITDELMELRK